MGQPGFVLCLTAIALMFAPGLAQATCVYASGFHGPFTVSVPLSGSYKVPRDIPVGTPIVSIAVPDPVPYGTAMASCSTAGSQNIVATSMPHGAQELTYRTFPTNIPGIGARLCNTAGSPDNACPHSSAYTAPVGIYYGHSFTLQFVKVANVTGAGIVQAADVVSFQYDTDGNPVYLNFIATGSTFVTGSMR